MKKIIFYYHHFGGLGHGMRIYSICKAIRELNSGYKIFVLNSGIPQPEIGIDQYAKIINLPYLKAKESLFSGLYSPQGIEATFRKRKIILSLIAAKLKPDIAIFEHFPFGRDLLENEIVRFIEELKREKTLIYSSTRDIIDQVIASSTLAQRQQLFNGFFIHSDEDMGFITKFKQSQDIKKKLIFTGRVCSGSLKELGKTKKIKDELGYKRRKLILISIGGGIDGFEIIEKLIEAKDKIDEKVKTFYLISTGPSVSQSLFIELKNKLKRKNNIKVKKFIPNYLNYVAAADLYISMGGYNSINNSLVSASKTIVFPRQSDQEQKIRGKYFSKFLNIADWNHSSGVLASKVIKLISNKSDKSKYKSEFNGAKNTARFIDRVLNLKYIKIRLTGKCNCDCDMCTIKHRKADLDFLKVKKVIQQARLLNLDVINFTGGEPTIYPQLYELMDYVKQEGMKLSLSTNGVFNKKVCQHIIKFADSIDISLDSYQGQVHDRIRGAKGGFDKAISNIKLIKKSGKFLHVNVTVRPDNYLSIHRMVPLLSEDINSISFTFIDTSINKLKCLEFKKNEIENFYFKEVPLILKQCMLGNIRVTITPFFSELVNLNNKQKYEKFLKNKKTYFSNLKSIFKVDDQKGCKDAREGLRINSDGQVCPCCSLDDYPINLGNIDKESLLDIVSSAKYCDFISSAKPDRGWCKKCKIGYRIYSKFF